jgi:Signal recognition particle receptor beta subunit
MAYVSLDPYLGRAARLLSNAMRSAGLVPPPERLLIPALVFTLFTLLIGASFLVTIALAPSRHARDTVLIVGASPSSTVAAAPGKTTLFHALRSGHAPPFGTVPSQIPNEAVFSASAAASFGSSDSVLAAQSSPVKWVDFPGAARLRPQLSAFLTTARIVVVVVDSSVAVFTRTVRETSDLLHEVLTNATVAKHATPVLVFCNKADTLGAASPATVRTRLEAELERARKAKSGMLSGASNATVLGGDMSVADAGQDTILLGYENEMFNFDHVSNVVQFASGSAKLLDAACVSDFVAAHF